ncbi:MAG: hypothetical protein KDA85_22265, partial [Planctomycetaceae bacterium]|nr:hypothetical protein [Planctomycetaceae bacterium]
MTFRHILQSLSNLIRLVIPAGLGAMISLSAVQWLGVAGTTPASLAALIAGFCGGILLANSLRVMVIAEGGISARAGWAMHERLVAGSLTLLVLLSSWSFSWLFSMFLDIGALLTAEFGMPSFVGFLPIAACLATLTAIMHLWSVVGGRQLDIIDRSRGDDATVMTIPGLAIGAVSLLLHVWWTMPLAVTVSGWVAVAIVCRIGLEWKRKVKPQTFSSGGEPTGAVAFDCIGRTERGFSGFQRDLTDGIIRWMIGIGFGLTAVAAVEWLTRLMPASLPVGLLTAAVAGSLLWLADRTIVRRLVPRGFLIGVALIPAAVIPLFFNDLMLWNLDLNVNVVSPLLLFIHRAFQFGIVIGGLLVVVRRERILHPAADSRNQRQEFLRSDQLIAVCSGL